MHLLLLKAPANSNQRRPRQAAQRATPRSPSPPACPHPSFLPGWKIWPQTALVTGKSRVSSSKQNRDCELSSFCMSSEGMAWKGCDPALAGPARKVGVCFSRQEGCQEQGELCQREGDERLGWGVGGWAGRGYGREMHVGEMDTALVGQARREDQQEVTYSIQLSAQLSFGRCWSKPTASPHSCSLGQGRKGKEARKEGRTAVRQRALQLWGQLLGRELGFIVSVTAGECPFPGAVAIRPSEPLGCHFGFLDYPVLQLGAWPESNTWGRKRKKET